MYYLAMRTFKFYLGNLIGVVFIGGHRSVQTKFGVAEIYSAQIVWSLGLSDLAWIIIMS